MALEVLLMRNGIQYKQLYPIEGQVQYNAGRNVRGWLHASFVDYDGTIVPKSTSDPLTPYGSELWIKRGLYLPSGTAEMVRLGKFYITDVNVYDTGGYVRIDVDAYDFGKKVERARLTDTHVIASGTNYGSAIQDLVQSRVSGLTFNPTDWATVTDLTTPRIILDIGTDPWDASIKLAAAIGHTLFFNNDGECTFMSEPSSNATPAWTFEVDKSNSTPMVVYRRFNNDETYNHVKVIGKPTDNSAPVYATTEDTNSSSPTYIDGPYGIFPFIFDTTGVKDANAAQQAADAKFLQVSGRYEGVNFNCVPMPALEIYDSIQLIDANLGMSGIYVLDQVSTPLVAIRQQELTCRTRVAA
jgi:hypothetical protein